MTADQNRILELFRALAPKEQEALLFELEQVAGGDVSAEDLAAIDEGLAEADRGEVVDAEEALARTAARFGFRRA